MHSLVGKYFRLSSVVVTIAIATLTLAHAQAKIGNKAEIEAILKASAAGEKDAQIKHAELAIHRAKGVKYDEEFIYKTLSEAADSGNVKAYYGLGRCFLDSIGTNFNPLKSYEYALKSHEAGDKNGRRLLAKVYAHGCHKAHVKSVLNPESKNIELYYKYINKAIELLKKGIDEGDVLSEIALIEFYIGDQASALGKNSRVVRKEGKVMLNKLVASGNATAQWIKAKQVLEDSPAEAEKLAYDAAKGGEYRALAMVAKFLSDKGNIKKSGNFIKQGMAAGDPAAVVLYAKILSKHSKSRKVTAKWMKPIQELQRKGYPMALRFLGDYSISIKKPDEAISFYSQVHTLRGAVDDEMSEKVIELCKQAGGLKVKSVANLMLADAKRAMRYDDDLEPFNDLVKLVTTHKDLKGNKEVLIRLVAEYKRVYEYKQNTKSPERFSSVTLDGVLELVDKLDLEPTDYTKVTEIAKDSSEKHIKGPLYEEAALMHPLYDGKKYTNYKLERALNNIPVGYKHSPKYRLEGSDPAAALEELKELHNLSVDSEMAGRRIPMRETAVVLAMLGKNKEGANFLYRYSLSDDIWYKPTYEGQRDLMRPENALVEYLQDKKNQSGIKERKAIMYFVKLLRQKHKKDVTDQELEKFRSRYSISKQDVAIAKKMLETKKLDEPLILGVKEAIYSNGKAPKMMP